MGADYLTQPNRQQITNRSKWFDVVNDYGYQPVSITKDVIAVQV